MPTGTVALGDVSFAVPEGGSFALIGPNGAGKTTALRLLCGISYPTAGRIRVRGRVGALVEVGSGLHLELTARENVVLYAVARLWGEWHLAEALARALHKLDRDVHVETLSDWSSLAGTLADVVVHFRGLLRSPRAAAQLQVLWWLYGPERVTTEECDAADLVLVASEPFTAQVRMLTRTPVHTFLHATDERRFRPVRADPQYRHELAYVGHSRGELRRGVRLALQAGLRPAIYGRGWDQLVDPALIRAEEVPNHELPALYSSVDVLLCDHSDTMRTCGFVSNRVFDAVACGAVVLSDDVLGLDSLLPGGVRCYRDADELRGCVEEPHDVGRRRRLAEAGRAAVLAEHTLDARARQLDALVGPLLKR